jgi:hypothetical protein
MANWTAPYCSLAQFFSDLVRSHIAALSQNIGAEGRGEGSLLNAAIFESPPPPAYWPTSPEAEKGLRFTQKKGSTVIPRRAIKVNSPARCEQIVRFAVSTSVGIADQVCNEMPAEARTTDATVKLKPLRFNQAPSTCSLTLCFDQTLSTKHAFY